MYHRPNKAKNIKFLKNQPNKKTHRKIIVTLGQANVS